MAMSNLAGLLPLVGLMSTSSMRKYPTARDKTMYAVDCGYTGSKRVLVHDGRVVSHGHVEWSVFIGRLLQAS